MTLLYKVNTNNNRSLIELLLGGLRGLPYYSRLNGG